MRRFLQPYILTLVIVVPLIALIGCSKGDNEGSDIPITTRSSEARSYFLEGRAAYDLSRSDDASILFDKAIAADSTFALACFYRARTATSPSDWKRYTDLSERFAAAASRGERLLIALLKAESQNDLPEQLSLARRLTVQFPGSPRALTEYAAVLAASQKTYQARTLLESALELNGLFAPALRALASSYLFDDPRDAREAEAFARKYVNNYPEEADPHILLGDIYRAGMQLEEARGEYTRAMIVKKNSYIAYVKRGHALTFIGLYSDARNDFARAVELGVGPAKSRAANYRTFTWIYAGQLPQAIIENQALLKSLPLLGFDENYDFQPYMNTWLNQFLMCVAVQNFNEAEQALAEYARFARAIAEQINAPNYTRITESEIALLEGRLSLARGEIIAATGYADRSTDKLRTIRSARKKENTELLRARISLQKAEYAKALEHLDEANPDFIQVKFYRALAFEGLGRSAEAQELYREVENWDFNDIEYALIRDEAISRIR